MVKTANLKTKTVMKTFRGQQFHSIGYGEKREMIKKHTMFG